MASTAKLSSKSQITVPAWARKRLGIGPGSRVVLRVDGDRIVLERVDTSIASLEGSLKGVYGDARRYVRDSRKDRFSA